ncbi:FAD-dependent oxidoreductase [Desertivirga xinjiangensis]|uniref:FAD-dependent oxidoreductase n=1 Tax=Desertivirga xinjiangensis TaxID=539206 RepID=UPI00210E5397|nr:FAD-dependent oxidoreductase [Pedobacter xinjiangensis]
MKVIRLFLILCLSSILSFSIKADQVANVDICVYGGTSAGVIAAYTAKKMGKSVVLIEPRYNLGGMSSGGLGYTDIGNKYVVTGLARDFYRRLGKHYGKLEQWIFEPGIAEKIFNQYIDETEVEVWYGRRLAYLEKKDGRICEITVEDTAAPQAGTNKRIKAAVFIDCTYEGDLMAKAGASYTVGREANSVYGETYNGVQLMKGHQFWDDVDPYLVKGDPASGLLWGISNNRLEKTGSGDRKVQAYNFRITLTDDPANRVNITEPDRYDPKKYELLARFHETAPRKSLHDLFTWSLMPNRKTDINNKGGFSTDMIGANWDYPEAPYEEREKIWQQHVDYTKGLLYFVGNDPRMPENIRQEMKRWGYPKDEYVKNGHWSHQLYVREARRLKGELVMTQHHCEGREVCHDAIGWAAYTMDSHNCDRLVVDGFVRNEGNVEVDGFPPFPISYKAITPQKKEVENLLVPVCLSASHIAYGSIRMEPVFMVLAQSAAVAACMAVERHVAVQDIDVASLQEQIRNNPLTDHSTAEILIDNDDRKAVTVSGNWELRKDTYRSYGAAANFLVAAGNERVYRSVKYTPEILSEKKYAVYAYIPMIEDLAERTRVMIYDGKKTIEKTISKADIVAEGQTGGEWAYLGTYKMPRGRRAYVEINNKDEGKAIVADAVLFSPSR